MSYRGDGRTEGARRAGVLHPLDRSLDERSAIGLHTMQNRRMSGGMQWGAASDFPAVYEELMVST